ncbi:hypothetical protein TRVA0_011S01178 [Trichomonascus vanleenenianus]|uniref:type 2C protein phosphatase PTC7 n=1 Tax=Trichomonascus vanleenenianus TaxID=2268995 RepID=UPI003ECAB953
MSIAGQYLSGGSQLSSLPQSLQTVIARAPRSDKISSHPLPSVSSVSAASSQPRISSVSRSNSTKQQSSMSTRTGGFFRLQRTLSVVRRGLSSRSAYSSTTTTANFSTMIAPLYSAKEYAPLPASPGDRFSFQLAESYSPKMRDAFGAPKKQLQLSRPNTGEDSFFCCCIETGPFKGTVGFAVADGVGGWAEVGIDPSDFSHTLCEKMHSRFKALERAPSISASSSAASSSVEGSSADDSSQATLYSGTAIAPSTLLEGAFGEIKAEKKVMAGSSTACVGVVSPHSGELQVANLGDSGFLIFREGRLLRQSKPQVHTFNTPYQMAVVPDSWIIDRRQQIADDPSDAEVSVHELQHGDVVIFATDGLTDNLFAHEILKQVTETMLRTGSWIKRDEEIVPGKTMTGGAELASSLVKHAAVLSVDSRRSSPFSQELKRVHSVTAYGGKPDDVTVVVLLVQKASPPPSSPSTI